MLYCCIVDNNTLHTLCKLDIIIVKLALDYYREFKACRPTHYSVPTLKYSAVNTLTYYNFEDYIIIVFVFTFLE